MFVLRRLDGLAARYPVSTACGTAAFKTTSADVVVQMGVEQREQYDVQRTVAFGLFGFGWMGAGQYLVYVKLLPRLLPATTLPHTIGKVVLDQMVHVPFVFMPLFYLTDGWVQGKPMIEYAKAKWWNEIPETMVANWKIWLPVCARRTNVCLTPSTLLSHAPADVWRAEQGSFIGFRFVPHHLRIPYVSCVSFAWTMILSRIQGRFRDAARTAEQCE